MLGCRSSGSSPAPSVWGLTLVANGLAKNAARDVKKAHQMTRRLRAGTVWVNTYGLMDAALPFGGYKQSGFGRELGSHAVEHYTELKSVWLNMA